MDFEMAEEGSFSVVVGDFQRRDAGEFCEALWSVEERGDEVAPPLGSGPVEVGDIGSRGGVKRQELLRKGEEVVGRFRVENDPGG